MAYTCECTVEQNAHKLLESKDNLRPSTATVRKKPKTVRYRVRIHEEIRPGSAALPPPKARLRLDEAFENAQRNRQTHVFAGTELSAVRMSWKKKAPTTDEDEYPNLTNDKVTVAQLLKPSRTADPAEQLARIKLRGEEGMENRMRGQGSLTLKSISKAESEEAVRQDVHVRCSGDEALGNRNTGRNGTGVSALLDQRQRVKAAAQVDFNRRAVRTEEAAENWRRDRCKDYTEMERVLNQGWSGRGLGGNLSKPQTASGVGQLSHSLWGQANGNADRPPQSAGIRGVSQSGAAYALREGSAMAERMGLSRPSSDKYADDDEVLEVRERALHSSDQFPNRTGPKARFEGVDNAMRSRGTLAAGLIPTDCSVSETPSAPRLKGDAFEIAAANKGSEGKLLLTNWRLPPDPRPAVRSLRYSKSIRDRSRGAEARSCINPTRAKWSGKVHWKRRPPAPVKCTF